MTLQKALEILIDYHLGVEMEELREYPDVIKLALEAMQVLLGIRKIEGMACWRLLPGETKD
ncbi:unnamed protein product [marine sediment metagenome]|uniref:Uncharacterized protein n=1 Tax=marine sediment metagenome TaxID=412755 RepID=X1HPL1_9ZZZZ